MKNRRLSTCGFLFALFAVVEGGGLNVVDGPISWRAPSADLRGRKEKDHFGPARLAEALVQGRREQNYVGLLR